MKSDAGQRGTGSLFAILAGLLQFNKTLVVERLTVLSFSLFVSLSLSPACSDGASIIDKIDAVSWSLVSLRFDACLFDRLSKCFVGSTYIQY